MSTFPFIYRYMDTHPVLSPWAPRLEGAGLAVLWGGGVTEEEAEPAAAELIGVKGQEAEGGGLVAERKRGIETEMQFVFYVIDGGLAAQRSHSVIFLCWDKSSLTIAGKWRILINSTGFIQLEAGQTILW